MRLPTTAAGRTLLGALKAQDRANGESVAVDWEHGILAIEAEAGQTPKKMERVACQHQEDAMTTNVTTSHEHQWRTPEGPYVVIDTFPQQDPYECACGAFTHDPDDGSPCPTCAPLDYAKRGPTVILRGGPFDGSVVTRPNNRSVHLRVDPLEKRVQKYVTYEATDDPAVWKFRSNDWTHPFEPRTPTTLDP